MASVISALAFLLLATAAIADESFEEDASEECHSMHHHHDRKKGENCCEMPTPIKEELKEEDKKKLLLCLKAKRTEFRGSGQPENQEHPGQQGGTRNCILECFYNISGLLADNKLNEEAIREKSMEVVGNDNDWKPVNEAALTTCFKSANTNINKNSPCKSGSAQFTKCVMREMYMNCPESKWNDSESCKKEKEMMKKCPKYMPFLRKYHRKTGPH